MNNENGESWHGNLGKYCAINRMTNVKHKILSNYYFYLLQFSARQDKNLAPGLLPTFAMRNHPVLGSGDTIQTREN